jgi:hypothetical protein
MVTVLFIHGMGTFGPGWSKSAQDALDRAAQDHGYTFFKKQLPSAQVQFAECVYDDKFDDALQAWSTLASDAGAQSILQLDWMKELNANPNFIKTHVLDVAQWYFLGPKRDQIINALASQLLGMNLKDTHIVAHSLGTSVAQKALQAVGSGVYPGWSSKLGKVQSLHMVANVSRVLEDARIPVHGGNSPSVVRPQLSAKDRDFFCLSYYSYHHVLDPFTLVKPFSPPPWQVDDFFDGAVRTTRGLTQVHDLEHYLAAPEVHIPLFRCLFDPSAVTPEEELRALPSQVPQLPILPVIPDAGGVEAFLRTIAQNAQLLH